MSHTDAAEPICTEQDDLVIINSNSKDLGELSVRRVLPASLAPSIGPFVFFDHMGPAEFAPGTGINVRPHPHIGLATVTFLFEGEILHRDSLGYTQAIQPGAVNFMEAGRGIVHSERTSDERLKNGQKLHGIQVWMALPEDQQEVAPSFVHHPADDLPRLEDNGLVTTVIIGSYGGKTSPVSVRAETLYLDHHIKAGTQTILPDAVQRGVYVIEGEISLNDRRVEPGTMAVVRKGSTVTLSAESNSHYMTIGGDAMAKRHLWWNFVHTSRDRIEQAKADWSEGRFDPVPGDEEFIPLPD